MRCRERTDRWPSSKKVGETFQSVSPYTVYVKTADAFIPTAYLSVPRLRETCWDETHQGPPFKEGGPLNVWNSANGGPLDVDRCQLDADPSSTIRYRYVGSFYCNWSPYGTMWPATGFSTKGSRADATSPNGDNPTWGNISSRGATAWKKYRPGKATADAGVFLGEIREVPRMLMTTAKGFRDVFVSMFGRIPTGKTRKAANHWLNTQFGWKPFLSDLRNFHKTYAKSAEMLSQIRRDNNQWVKRGGSVFAEDSRTVWASSLKNHLSGPDFSGIWAFWRQRPYKYQTGSHTITRVTGQRVWFEARFKYHIKNIDNVTWSKRATEQLYGLEVNPALVWELTPWSWLVDWCSNVGDVFSNLDTGLAQNLVAKYAYVMGTTEERADVVSIPEFFSGNRTHEFSFYLRRKQRVEANPFGFGLTWDMLSLRQWSILGALGITRFPH